MEALMALTQLPNGSAIEASCTLDEYAKKQTQALYYGLNIPSVGGCEAVLAAASIQLDDHDIGEPSATTAFGCYKSSDHELTLQAAQGRCEEAAAQLSDVVTAFVIINPNVFVIIVH